MVASRQSSVILSNFLIQSNIFPFPLNCYSYCITTNKNQLNNNRSRIFKAVLLFSPLGGAVSSNKIRDRLDEKEPHSGLQPFVVRAHCF